MVKHEWRTLKGLPLELREKSLLQALSLSFFLSN